MHVCILPMLDIPACSCANLWPFLFLSSWEFQICPWNTASPTVVFVDVSIVAFPLSIHVSSLEFQICSWNTAPPTAMCVDVHLHDICWLMHCVVLDIRHSFTSDSLAMFVGEQL